MRVNPKRKMDQGVTQKRKLDRNPHWIPGSRLLRHLKVPRQDSFLSIEGTRFAWHLPSTLISLILTVQESEETMTQSALSP